MSDLVHEGLLPFQRFSASFAALALVALGCSSIGVLVVLRRIVFVGVALAEVSALGVGFAFFTLALLPEGRLFEWWHHWGPVASASALALAFVAALSSARLGERVSREAVIGVVHALAAGLALVLVWRSAEGLEELRHLLAGDVLFVHGRHLAALGAAIGVALAVHGAFGRALVLVAYDPDVAASLGFRVGRWQLLHAVLIGLTVAVSTWVGGVMLAFGLLVVPAFAALQLARRLGEAIALSVALGLGASAVGLEAACHLDYPTPPAIIAALLVPLAAVGCERWLGIRRLAWAVAAPGVLLAIVGGVVAAADLAGAPLLATRAARQRPALRQAPHADHAPHHDAPRLLEARARAEAARELGQTGDPKVRPTLEVLLDDRAPEVRAAALEALGRLGDRGAGDAIAARLPALTLDLRLEAARALVALGDGRGEAALVELLAEGKAPAFLRDEAAALLERRLGSALGYDASLGAGDAANRAALERARTRLAGRAAAPAGGAVESGRAADAPREPP